LLFNLTNAGRPLIAVRDGNYKNRGEMFLEHQFEGVELKLNEAADTLAALFKLWTRPVHVETVIDGKRAILSFDGTEHHTEKCGEAEK
jgi:stage V sporulation protein R